MLILVLVLLLKDIFQVLVLVFGGQVLVHVLVLVGQVLVLVLVLVGQILVLILILVVKSLSLSLFLVLARTCFHYSIIPIYSDIIVVSMHTISFNCTYLCLSCRHIALRHVLLL